MTGQTRRRRAPVSSVAALVIGILGLFYVQSNAYYQDLYMLTLTYALLALGLYIPFIMTGALSLAYSAYLTIGGYAVAKIATETGLPLIVGVILGAIVSSAVAVVLGLATRRLSSFYLAAVTLLFAKAFGIWLLDADGITKGAGGIGGIRPFSMFGYDITRGQFLVMAMLIVWAFGSAINRLRRGPFGIAIRARNQIPLAVESAGMRVSTLTLISLAAGAAIASVGGALFTSYNGAVGPETFTLPVVFLAVFMPLLGGQQSAWGAVLGALVVVYSSFNFTWFEDTGTLAFAVAVLVVLLIAPNGILGSLNTGLREMRNSMNGRGARSGATTRTADVDG